MINKSAIYSFGGANQDISRSKHSPQYYFEAQHIKIVATDSQTTASASNEKGNDIVVTIPTIVIDSTSNVISYGSNELPFTSSQLNNIGSGELEILDDQIIIGHTETRDSVILFTTNSNGADCVWLLQDVLSGGYNLKLLYIRDLGFNKNNPIQAVFNYENVNLQKVYWVDGVNQEDF